MQMGVLSSYVLSIPNIIMMKKNQHKNKYVDLYITQKRWDKPILL